MVTLNDLNFVVFTEMGIFPVTGFVDPWKLI